MELGQGRVRLGIRERFFTKKVVGHWDRLPREVATPSLMEFRKHLDSALRPIACLWMVLSIARRRDCSSFQIIVFYDSASISFCI